MRKKISLLRLLPIYILTAACFLVATFGTSKAVTTLVENTPVPRMNIIVIDAGHGGEDGGATSCTGVLESNINLEIALRLDNLCHLLGYSTIMIRTSDISIYTEGNTIAAKKVSDLKNRVRIVEQTENAILLSIHQNTFSDSRYSGAQVFYAQTEGSKALAAILQENFLNAVNPGSNRVCKSADSVYLMQHISRPGVLVECGFLSNPEEEAKLRDQAYQKKLCCIMVSALSVYLNA